MASTGYLSQPGGILRILYLGVRNTIEGIEDAALIKSNNIGNAQLVANTQTAGVNKLGCLAGTVAVMKGNAVTGAGAAPNDPVVGLYVNDLAGNAYESSSAASSDKGVYVHAFGTYEANIYETHNYSGAGSILANYTVGKNLYCSRNGYLTVEEGLNGGTAPSDAVIIGIITQAPTASDPFMRFNLRI